MWLAAVAQPCGSNRNNPCQIPGATRASHGKGRMAAWICSDRMDRTRQVDLQPNAALLGTRHQYLRFHSTIEIEQRVGNDSSSALAIAQQRGLGLWSFPQCGVRGIQQRKWLARYRPDIQQETSGLPDCREQRGTALRLGVSPPWETISRSLGPSCTEIIVAFPYRSHEERSFSGCPWSSTSFGISAATLSSR
jgi:hypothetical protein